MRQVPTYLIIGNGRMANHICHYLKSLSLPYITWSRSKNTIEVLASFLSNATHVLILINDGSIDAFIEAHIISHNQQPTLIHFSGNLISKYAHGAHPLQTFGNKLYSINDYKKIPFVIESDSSTFSELLPGFENPHYKINRVDKNYYHALCVMANNFTTLLWQKFFSEMQNRFEIKVQHLQPFLDQTFHNIKHDVQNALTGPIARKDRKTLSDDLKALNDDHFFKIFEAFTKTFIKEI
ncbi:MAG: hypothetical protein ACD_29C00481G0001 [uncultured bacterium]|nr:MAG: hypothetical protein ACD_29C00481G0001 [uncultured bacterium]